MAGPWKDVQQSKDISLNSAMNDRSNPVFLDKQQDGNAYFNYLQNSDSFYQNNLTSRLGTASFVTGLCQFNQSTSVSTINTETNLPSGTFTGDWFTNFGAGSFYDYLGTLIVPSGNMNLFQGDLTIRGDETAVTVTGNAYINNDLIVTVNLYQLNQNAIDLTHMSGNSASDGNVHAISISGNYNVPTYPNYSNPTTLPGYVPNDPLAMSTPVRINLGQYTPGSGNGYTSQPYTINWTFDPPVNLVSGNVYFLQHWIQTAGAMLDSGRGFDTAFVYISGNDISPNTTMAQEFNYVGLPANQTNAIRLPLALPPGLKAWVSQDLSTYVSPPYMIVENPTALYDTSSPITSGLSFVSGGDSPFTYATNASGPWNGKVNVPGFGPAVEFGEVITMPTGNNVIYGSYFFANTFSGNNYVSTIQAQNAATAPSVLYSRNKTLLNPSGYQSGFYGRLSQITSDTGSMSNGTYKVLGRQVVASFSGTYTFDNPLAENVTVLNSMAGGLEKIYAIFDNPVVINNTGTSRYLLSFGWYDAGTGLPNTDYSTTYIFPHQGFTTPFKIGVEYGKPFSGTYVFNSNNDGQTFQQANYNYSTEGGQYNLTCGLIALNPSGSSINGINDYTTSTLLKTTVYHQGGEIKTFFPGFTAPQDHVVLKTGLASNINALASYITFNDLNLSCDYSFDPPQIWSSIYFAPTGNSTYDLGHQQTFNVSLVPGSGNLVSGNYNILLATQLFSGGWRGSQASNVGASGINVTGTCDSNGVVTGTVIEISNLNTLQQYPFDLYNDSAVSVYVTVPSGIALNNDPTVYYAANLSSGNVLSTGSTYYSNPLPNTVNVTYFNNIDGIGNNIVDDVINENQAYLLNQTPIPKVKQFRQFYNYVLAYGDPENPSRLYYSDQYAPQIWGGVSSNYGSVDVGSTLSNDAITGMAPWKTYMIIFKTNSTWILSYTDNAIPFQLQPVSPNNGSLAIFSTISTDDYVYGINQYGIFRATAYNVECISKCIDVFFKTLNVKDLIFSTALHSQDRKEISWSISNNVFNLDSDTGIVYNYEFNTFNIRVGGLWNSCAVTRDENGFDVLLAGTSLGQINQINEGNSDSDILFADDVYQTTIGIPLEAQTTWLFFDNDSTNKIINMLHVNVEQNTGYLYVDVYFDGNLNKIQYTRKISLSSANPDKVVSMGGQARSVTLAFRNVGNSSPISMHSFSIDTQTIGLDRPM